MNAMNNRTEIIKEFKRAMEFYRELGFKYLPLKESYFQGYSFEYPGLPAAMDVVPESRDNETALKRLKDEIGDCRRCKLCDGRKNVVFGEGNPDARLMFVGEGPGREEDIQSRPFVGDAGKLLTNMLVKLGLKREDVYIANIVKCRPPYNRNPEEDEIVTCRPFLEKQIDIIVPEIIVCLGRISAHALLEVKIPISKLRGNFSSYKNFPVMPTFHPAYLLRNPKDKWLTWDDMKQVMDRLKC